jgi:hypothetical protein
LGELGLFCDLLSLGNIRRVFASPALQRNYPVGFATVPHLQSIDKNE